MVEDEIRHASSTDSQVGIVEYDILHVLLVQLAVNLRSRTLEACT